MGLRVPLVSVAHSPRTAMAIPSKNGPMSLCCFVTTSSHLFLGSVDGITKKLAETEIDSKSKGAHGKEPAADKATKKGKALKTTTSSVAANEWDDQLMGMSVEKFNEELAVLLPKANLFMENALSFINEQMTNNGIGIGAAGGSCSAGIPAN